MLYCFIRHRVFSETLTYHLGGKKISVPSEHNRLCVKNEANPLDFFFFTKTKQNANSSPTSSVPSESILYKSLSFHFTEENDRSSSNPTCISLLSTYPSNRNKDKGGYPRGCLAMSITSKKMLRRSQRT